MSYQAEVTTAGDGGKYAGNALRFATQKEAEIYALDLMSRWTMVTDTRVSESPDPVNYWWNPVLGRAVSVAETEIVHVTA